MATAYIAGPIRGVPDSQEHFSRAAVSLAKLGYTPINPIAGQKVSTDHQQEYNEYYSKGMVPPWVTEDLAHILSLTPINGDILVTLDGWENSKGAQAEVALARWLNIPVISLAALQGIEVQPQEMINREATPRERLLDLHHNLSNAARDLMAKKNHDYASNADPYRNFRLFGTFGILVRLGDKFSRLRSFEESGEFAVQSESVVDTVLDIINYAVLYLGMKTETKA